MIQYRLAAVDDAEVIANARISLTDEDSGVSGAVRDELYVAPPHRRRGVGRELIARTVTETQTRGFTRITLSATEKGAELFRTCGFEDAPHVGLTEMEYTHGKQ